MLSSAIDNRASTMSVSLKQNAKLTISLIQMVKSAISLTLHVKFINKTVLDAKCMNQVVKFTSLSLKLAEHTHCTGFARAGAGASARTEPSAK